MRATSFVRIVETIGMLRDDAGEFDLDSDATVMVRKVLQDPTTETPTASGDILSAVGEFTLETVSIVAKTQIGDRIARLIDGNDKDELNRLHQLATSAKEIARDVGRR